MTSLVIALTAALSGRGKGITGNSTIVNPITGRTLNQNLQSTLTGGSKATNGYVGTRTLTASANETLDLRSFTNIMNETAQSLSKLKLFFVKHSSTSSASTISVGNSGANALIIHGCFGSTTADLAPGGTIIIEIPTTNGVTVDATHKDIKVVNNDGVNSASYEIGWFGE